MSAIVNYLVPLECFHEVVVEGNYFNTRCLLLMLCKVLGIMIVFNSFTAKVPQIQKIRAAKSGAGVLLFSQLMELFAYFSGSSYAFTSRFPIMAYGEALLLAIQTVAICYYILYYENKTAQAYGFVAAAVAIVAIVYLRLLPPPFFKAMLSLGLPIMLAGRGRQIYVNWRNQGTGNLSEATIKRQLFNLVLRLFTTSVELGDVIMMARFGMASLAVGIVLAQIKYYATSPKKDI